MDMMVSSLVPSAHISLDKPLHNPTTLDSSLGISCQAHKWVHNMGPFYKESLGAYIWYQGHTGKYHKD
ncbi:hypothetical protein B9Z55_021804 [Caenorhabditis nigoni]|uniref:Uncharacterized protein n=1 Tax=Caenorhabditis nigoni TaxID=1611254 RepID=A0A2G5TTI1_9PELO|nr:hypothetical protein B9Z55_021804 [Caenorhabditis nigoni]